MPRMRRGGIIAGASCDLTMSHREEIARRYGFATEDELLKASTSLPLGLYETVPSYMAYSPAGFWFVWRDDRAHRAADDAESEY
jgi:hypothetical protein